MRKKYCWVVLLYCVTLGSFATDKVIYGNDDRVPANQITNEYLQRAISSTAAMISWELLDIDQDRVRVKGDTLEQSLGVCSTARFAQEKTPANCSGFLVADDILITAGHCMVSAEDCRQNAWVFDFVDNETELSYQHDVYRCLKVLKQSYTDELDFAIIKLDRSTDRNFLTYRQQGRIAPGTKVAVVGFPSGLPMKVAPGATVINNEAQDYFVTDLDTFGGNSGSIVINLEQGLIEGILVRGQEDYIYSNEQGCYVVNRCPLGGSERCSGEDVTRISSLHIQDAISKFQHSDELIDLIYKKDIDAVIRQLSADPTLLNSILDGELTPLMAAMWSCNGPAVKYCLQRPELDLSMRSNLDYSAVEYGILTHDFSTLYYLQQVITRDDFAVNQSSYSDMTALMFAAKYGRYDVLKLLLEKPQIDLTIQERRSGNSAVLFAAEANSLNSFKLLQQQGANILELNSDNMNALMLATEYGDLEMVQYLLDLKQYNLALSNLSGDTAAHIAAKNNSLAKLKLLYAAGADFSLGNNLAQTVWDILKIHAIPWP